MDQQEKRQGGFTLIELLIAIVVVGILAAVAIVGIGGLTGTGGKSACKASLDAATTASAAVYANNSNLATPPALLWPADFAQLKAGGTNAAFTEPAGANPLTSKRWRNCWCVSVSCWWSSRGSRRSTSIRCWPRRSA